MVVIRAEMWPKGDETKAYFLGTVVIVLKGIDEKGLRRYEWAISKFKSKTVWKRGTIDGHNPKNRGLWDLLYRIMELAAGARNNK